MTDTEAAGYESLPVAARAAVAEEPPSPPTAPFQEAARPGGSRAGRVWHRRGEAWGPFTISPIVRSADGRVTGYGAICGLHRDTGPHASTVQCKKAVSLSLREGAPTAEQIKVGLKRWLLAGLLDTQDWPVDGMRTTHVRLQLADLEAGPSQEEMDRWMARFSQEAVGQRHRL